MPDRDQSERTRDRGFQSLSRAMGDRGLTLVSANDRRRPSRVAIQTPTRQIEATVRSTNGHPSFQLTLTDFLQILEDDNGQQRISLLSLARPSDLYIFVWLGERKSHPDRYFFLTAGELQEVLRASHQRYLDSHGGTRAEKPDSTHAAIKLASLEPYEDNWLLLDSMNAGHA